MTDRRSRQPVGDSLGYNRMSERFEAAMAAVTERLEGFADQMDHKLSRVNRDLAQGEQDRIAIQREISELRRDMGELRETISNHDASTAREAAEGAAAGAAKVAVGVAATATAAAAAARRPSVTTLLATLLVALGSAVTWGPKLLAMVSQALHMTGRGAD